jgi:hypothetical protein
MLSIQNKSKDPSALEDKDTVEMELVGTGPPELATVSTAVGTWGFPFASNTWIQRVEDEEGGVPVAVTYAYATCRFALTSENPRHSTLLDQASAVFGLTICSIGLLIQKSLTGDR